MLTLLDEYFSTTTTIFSGWILHGSLSLAWKFVHAVLEHGDFVNIYFTTRLRCGRIFNNYFTANLLLNQAVKEFWKSIKIWRSYRREYCGMGFLRCIGYKTTANALRRVSERRSRLCMGQHRDAACLAASIRARPVEKWPTHSRDAFTHMTQNSRCLLTYLEIATKYRYFGLDDIELLSATQIRLTEQLFCERGSPPFTGISKFCRMLLFHCSH